MHSGLFSWILPITGVNQKYKISNFLGYVHSHSHGCTHQQDREMCLLIYQPSRCRSIGSLSQYQDTCHI